MRVRYSPEIRRILFCKARRERLVSGAANVLAAVVSVVLWMSLNSVL